MYSLYGISLGPTTMMFWVKLFDRIRNVVCRLRYKGQSCEPPQTTPHKYTNCDSYHHFSPFIIFGD